MHSFCFEGGETKNPPIQKTFLFGIVGGKEIPVYKLVKMDKAESKDKIEPKITFVSPNSDISNLTKIRTYTSDIPYWKLFVSASAFGVRKRVHSIYFEITDDLTVPISTIYPIINTNSFRKALLSYNTSVQHCDHIFIGRIKFIGRSELPSILGEDALAWAKRVSPPPISLLRNIVHVDKKSVKRTGRLIRLQN